MNEQMQSVFELVLDCYLDQRDHIDQYEVAVLRESAQQGIHSFDNACHKVFGKAADKLFYAALEKIRNLLEFQLTYQIKPNEMTDNQIDMILESTKNLADTAPLLLGLCKNSWFIPSIPTGEIMSIIDALIEQINSRLHPHINRI